MTKFVTASDALVLSPVGWPTERSEIPEVADAFARVVSGFSEGQLVGSGDAKLLVGHRSAPDLLFRALPVLRDGFTVPSLVPPKWDGRITKDVLASYLRSDLLFWPRRPSWGARLDFATPAPGDEQDFQLVSRAKLPLIDPLRETAADDDETTLPLAVEVEGEWVDFLNPWEHTDAFLGGKNPGQLWLALRSARFQPFTDRWWWELRGLRDSGDARRYGSEQWSGDRTITAFLGWHAFAIAAAGAATACPACGRWVIQGRHYCGAVNCNRARAAERQRIRRLHGRDKRRPG